MHDDPTPPLEGIRGEIRKIARAVADGAVQASRLYEMEPDEWTARIIANSAKATALAVGDVIADWCAHEAADPDQC